MNTECFVEVKPGGDIMYFVDGVIDSSRYYVLRLQDRASTRSVLMGIGFRERDTAFDFKNALNDYVRYVDRMATAEKARLIRAESGDTDEKNNSGISITNDSKNDGKVSNTNSTAVISLSLHRDMSIPLGEKIRIKCKSKSLQTKGDHDSGTVATSSNCEKELKGPKNCMETEYLIIGHNNRETDSTNILSSGSHSSPKGKYFLAPPPSIEQSMDPIFSASFIPSVPSEIFVEDKEEENKRAEDKENFIDKGEEEEEEWGDFGSAAIV